MDNTSSSSRTDRKIIERNRRNQMKTLYSKLSSLMPNHTSRDAASLPDQLDEAAKYIKKLQTNLEKMKEKKGRLMEMVKLDRSTMSNETILPDSRSPQIKIREMGSALEVILMTGLDFQFMFRETIRVLQEEGAEIVNASFAVMDDYIFHTIHSEVGESASGHGAARISERLNKVVHDAN